MNHTTTCTQLIEFEKENKELIQTLSETVDKLNENVYPDYKVVGIIHNDKCIYGKDHFMEKIGKRLDFSNLLDK